MILTAREEMYTFDENDLILEYDGLPQDDLYQFYTIGLFMSNYKIDHLLAASPFYQLSGNSHPVVSG
jgi:hypothetical protein